MDLPVGVSEGRRVDVVVIGVLVELECSKNRQSL